MACSASLAEVPMREGGPTFIRRGTEVVVTGAPRKRLVG